MNYRVQYDWEEIDGSKSYGLYEDFETREQALAYYHQLRKSDWASHIEIFSLNI